MLKEKRRIVGSSSLEEIYISRPLFTEGVESQGQGAGRETIYSLWVCVRRPNEELSFRVEISYWSRMEITYHYKEPFALYIVETLKVVQTGKN